jgi:hypothetical protein
MARLTEPLWQAGLALKAALIGVLSTSCWPSDVAYAQDVVPVLVRVEDRTRITRTNRVVAREPSTGQDREIYRSEGDIFGHVALSPGGRYAAFIEVMGPGGARKQRLVIVEVSSGTVRRYGESSIYAARGIRDYVWCCGSGKVAIITGGLGDEVAVGESTTLPHGASVLDVTTGAAAPIEGVLVPLQIHWAEFDSSLYIKGTPQVPPETRGPRARPIYRYHVPSGRLSLTTHRGVFFSPDGKYYFDTGVYEASGSFQLFRTADDQDVTARLAVARHHLGPEGGWMPGAGNVLVFVEKPAPKPPKPPGPQGTLVDEGPRPMVYPNRWNVTVDAESGRVIDRFQGDIRAGWKTNAAALPVERRTGVELVLPHRP